jgi:penicillin-binding protein 1A
MGYPGRKRPLGNDMTGGKGALPMFVDFMKTYLKDKPKEEFPKAPSMPEDMKELFRQRQRELAAERADLAAEADKDADESATPTTTITEAKQENETMPPPPKTEEPAATQPKTEAPPKTETPPPAQTRPREAEPAKKKGKKGDGEPG